MTESAGENSSLEPDADASGLPTDSHGLEELRSLIVAPEQERLQQLQDRLDDPQKLAQDVSRALPGALVLRSGDPEVAKALAPTVEEAMAASVRANPQPLADALFPLMGPAIRKALTHALSSMFEGLNRAIEHSFSAHGLGWRLEALRTGRPFAEVVLRHTVVYRVEQVFLIHRQTGLLLQHASAEGAVVRDADMVSGMLSAIRDFIQDSFDAAQSGDTLETMRVGDMTVLLEQGPLAVLAGVVRGTAPAELHQVLQEALEAIHLRFSAALSSFQGDARPFASAAPYLESCLKSQYFEKERRGYTRVWAAAAVVLLLLGAGVFFWVRDSRRWNDYLYRLAGEPGLVVVSADRSWGKHYLVGLRDPLARDPLAILGETRLDPDTVISRWEPYQALVPQFIVARATIVLQPPPGVTLSYDNGVLYVRGPVDAGWLAGHATMARGIAGVSQLQRGESIEATLDRLQPEIESFRFRFETDASEPLPGQEKSTEALITKVRELAGAAQAAGKGLRLEVVGHADISGTADWNLALSQARAESVKKSLLAASIAGLEINAVGLGSPKSRAYGRGSAGAADDRSVTFRVAVQEDATGKRGRP